MNLRILATGGTFDKVYDPLTGALTFADTCIETLLAQCRTDAVVQTVMLMDSLEMDDSHRQLVVQACRSAAEPRLVIVHGSDTMVETAAALAAAGLAKTVVLTGAMVPNALRGTDAPFNLGFAIGCARLADPGVWVAMNGCLHRHDNVRKNRALGRFEPLAPAA
ncbi:MAG: asparaginase domain-containing protein [Burkholderiaceae bacterium]